MNPAGQKKKRLPPSILRFAVTAISIIGLMACAHDNRTSSDAAKEYRTKTGKTIVVSETHLVGRSLSTIEISTKGFEHNYAETYEDRDPISDVFVADLDGNGFDEIYVITRKEP